MQRNSATQQRGEYIGSLCLVRIRKLPPVLLSRRGADVFALKFES